MLTMVKAFSPRQPFVIMPPRLILLSKYGANQGENYHDRDNFEGTNICASSVSYESTYNLN